MSQALAEERYRRVGFTIAIVAVITLLAGLVATLDAQRLTPPSAAGPVLPGFAKASSEANLIVIQTRDATYRIARIGQGWALRDKGDYPVRRELLAQFTQGLAGLKYGRPMTRDPAKFDRLGLGDPDKGGDGVLVQVQNAQGAYLANLLLGIEPRGTYMRDPGKPQSWVVKGDLPPLQDPAAWLDLAPINIDKGRIGRVDLAPESGPPFSVKRDQQSDRDFSLAKPFDRFLVTTPDGLNDVGAAIAVLAPIDVAAAPAIAGNVRARIAAHTFDGLTIEGEIYGDGARHWLKLVARGDNPQAQAEAAGINARAAPWAYALADVDYQRVVPPLALIARAPAMAVRPAAAVPPSTTPTTPTP